MLFVDLIAIYFVIGLVWAVIFFLIGYQWVLADATGSGLLVRLLWLPAAVIIWPLLMLKCLTRD